MAFLQIVEFRTSRIDEGTQYVEEWERATEGRRTARRGILCQDRDDSTRYLNVVFFDSYESAMDNSNLPETRELAQQLMSLADGSPVFYNLDVIDDRTFS